MGITPAGNIGLSVAILFVGALPALVSRAIRICECASGARARKGGRGKNTYGVSVQVFVR